MSDALLTRIAEGIDGLRADLKKAGGAPSATATKPPAANAGGDAAAAKKAAEAAAAKKAAADAAAKAAAAPKGPAAGTKAPGGKRTVEQVREMIRKVAADKNLGKETAKDILRDDGGGVEKVVELKPEFYDAVYEACEVSLKGEGSGGAAPEEDDLM